MGLEMEIFFYPHCDFEDCDMGYIQQDENFHFHLKENS
jgi:hypothetical protein